MHHICSIGAVAVYAHILSQITTSTPVRWISCVRQLPTAATAAPCY